MSEVIVTGPATLLPWIATEPLSPFTVTGPTNWSGPHDDPGTAAESNRPAVAGDGDRALDR